MKPFTFTKPEKAFKSLDETKNKSIDTEAFIKNEQLITICLAALGVTSTGRFNSSLYIILNISDKNRYLGLYTFRRAN